MRWYLGSSNEAVLGVTDGPDLLGAPTFRQDLHRHHPGGVRNLVTCFWKLRCVWFVLLVVLKVKIVKSSQ